MAAAVIRALLDKYPAVPKDEVEDVILGCAMPEAESGMNMARIAALRAGLPDIVPGVTINRFCSSGLQSIAMAADRIRAGSAQIIIAGGSESMSMLPMAGNKFAPNPWFVDNRPEIYMGMGLTAERLQRKYGITAKSRTQFSLRSHHERAEAQRLEARSMRRSCRSTDCSQRRRSARRYLDGSTGETEAGVSCAGHGHRRQLVADVGRRRRCARHVGIESPRAWA